MFLLIYIFKTKKNDIPSNEVRFKFGGSTLKKATLSSALILVNFETLLPFDVATTAPMDETHVKTSVILINIFIYF